jgi:hypothetical protein
MVHEPVKVAAEVVERINPGHFSRSPRTTTEADHSRGREMLKIPCRTTKHVEEEAILRVHKR